MIDLAITNNNYFDIDFENGDFKSAYDLKTAILMSIFCEKRADPLQVPQVDQRRGDFTNQFNLINGYEVGSLYWLYTSQHKIDEANKEDLQDTINESLQWLIDDNYLSDIECNVEITNNQYIVNIKTADAFNNETSYTF